MGQAVSETYPALVVVGTVTDDFATAIISPDGQKKDHDYMRPKLEANPRYSHIAARAETGMRLLERGCESLSPPSDDDVNATVEKLRKPESTEGGRRVSVLKRQEGVPVNLG